MDGQDLTIEFYSEALTLGDEIKGEVRHRIQALTEGHKDILEASFAVEDIAGEENPFLHQVRIVVYMRPENIAVVEKGDAIMTTVKAALSTLERQVRKERERRKEISYQPKQKEPDIIYELTPEEMYETYTPSQDPQSLLDQGRSEIANSLMVEDGIEQKAAYYISDRILEYAENAVTAL